MSDLGCADGCGRQMGGENCADGCGRRGCKGEVGNGWGEEAAGDERAWLRGRVRTGNGSEVFAESFAGRGRDSMLDNKTVEIGWGELRWEGVRQHAGRRGNRANSL